MGAVCAVVYLLLIILFIPTAFYKDIVAATSGGGNRDVTITIMHVDQIETGRSLHRFPHNKLASYLSAVVTLALTIMLGLFDDLFDIRWRHKVLIPAIAAVPMLVIYFVDFGVTQVVVPTPLRAYLGELLNLGWVYYAYMAAFAIFCPNSINILAGINGLEVLQSLIIASLILLNDVLYILSPSHPATDSHLFSIYLLLPFVGVSLALWWHNAYPAKCFVGDTYCYFAGMIFAVDGILGHFSKTLWLLFIPQAFNFAYSCPQLFGLVPCPRHRMPRFNARTGLMEPSVATFPEEKPLRRPVAWVMKLMVGLGLLWIKTDEKGRVIESSNFTLINLWLVWFGPMREDSLCYSLCAMQFVVGLVGLFARHKLALLIFTEDNWSV